MNIAPKQAQRRRAAQTKRSIRQALHHSKIVQQITDEMTDSIPRQFGKVDRALN